MTSRGDGFEREAIRMLAEMPLPTSAVFAYRERMPEGPRVQRGDDGIWRESRRVPLEPAHEMSELTNEDREFLWAPRLRRGR